MQQISTSDALGIIDTVIGRELKYRDQNIKWYVDMSEAAFAHGNKGDSDRHLDNSIFERIKMAMLIDIQNALTAAFRAHTQTPEAINEIENALLSVGKP